LHGSSREDVASSDAAFAALMSRTAQWSWASAGAYSVTTIRADAFQAVFLVLARKAPQVQVDGSDSGAGSMG